MEFFKSLGPPRGRKADEGVVYVVNPFKRPDLWIAYSPGDPQIKFAEGRHLPVIQLIRDGRKDEARELVKKEILRQRGRCSRYISRGAVLFEFTLEELGLSRRDGREVPIPGWLKK
ncbi:hypothetical protein J7K42_02120 [bacterium]|nr:hypothetical protein [bacterium]